MNPVVISYVNGNIRTTPPPPVNEVISLQLWNVLFVFHHVEMGMNLASSVDIRYKCVYIRAWWKPLHKRKFMKFWNKKFFAQIE